MKRYLTVVNKQPKGSNSSPKNNENLSGSSCENKSSESDILKKKKYYQKSRAAWQNDPEFKNWIKIDNDNNNTISCKYCNIFIGAKLSTLRDHAKSKKHIKAAGPFSTGRQLKLPTLRSTLKHKTNEAEARISLFIAKHGTIRSVDHLVKINMKCFEDSPICQSLKLSKTKCSRIIDNVWYPYFKNKLMKDIGDSTFSLIIDESTDKTSVKYLGVVIKYFSSLKKRIETSFLKLHPIDACDAVGIVNAIKEILEEFGLKTDKMCGLGTDNANVMVGVHNGVYTRLKNINPNIILIPCICHSLQLAISTATAEALPDTIEFLVSETYSWFAYSPSRQLQYRKLYNLINDGGNPLKLTQISSTRWLSIEKAVSRICEQFLELKTHFSLAGTGEKCYKAKKLSKLYKDDLNLCYLLFLKPILQDVQTKFSRVEMQILLKFLMIYSDWSLVQ